MSAASRSLPSREWPVALVLAGLLALTGCGSGDASSTSTSTSTSTTAPTAAAEKPSPAPSHAQRHKGDSHGRAQSAESSNPVKKEGEGGSPKMHHGAAAEFETRGGDNSIQRFGSEGSDQEVAAAGAVLHDYLLARVGGNWSRMCSDLSRDVLVTLRQTATVAPSGSSGKPNSCPKTVEMLFAAMPPAAAREMAVARAAALRVRGDRGLLLFHGSYGTDYFVSMRKEEGKWKLAALAPSALP